MTPVNLGPPGARTGRKAMVFHIMYGYAAGLSDEQMAQWRYMAAEYINGERPLVKMPLTGGEFLTQWELEPVKELPNPGPACHGLGYRDDCPGCVSYWQD